MCIYIYYIYIYIILENKKKISYPNFFAAILLVYLPNFYILHFRNNVYQTEEAFFIHLTNECRELHSESEICILVVAEIERAY